MDSPNFSSITSKYNEPLDKKYHVPNLATAVASDTDYNTPNMVIFVRNEKAFYYLKDGALGNNISHWQKMGGANGSTAMFAPFDNAKIYAVGETCSVGVNMYICIGATTAGESPITTPTKWLQVGATSKFTANYTSQTSFTVTHAINNATMHVYDTATGRELNVLKTRVSASQFKVESNQATSGLIIIS